MTHELPPSPPGKWFIGNLRDFNSDSLGFLEHAATFGDVVLIRFGPFKGYFLNHPDHIHEVLVAKHDHFYKTRILKRSLHDVSGENILTGDGDFWKRQRKLMQPAFHAQRIGAYADTIVDLTMRVLESWHNGDEIDVDEAMTALTMNIITKTMFGTEIESETQEMGEAFTQLLRMVNRRIERIIAIPTWLPIPENRKIRRSTKTIRTMLQRFIDQRRNENVDKGDLLSMLLTARDEQGNLMSDEQIMNEAITIFGAGHETTANTLTFAWYALAKQPQVVQRLHEELEMLEGRLPSLADLPNLPYTEMVIKEALRLYPPAWVFTRAAIKPIEIGGYHFPRGSVAIISPWTLGRDARWFEDPERFIPERFTPDREAKIPKYGYIPFGGGPRICIGNQFAMLEARLVLATIAQRYTFSLKPGFHTQPARAFTLRPSNGMKMIVHAREERIPT